MVLRSWFLERNDLVRAETETEKLQLRMEVMNAITAHKSQRITGHIDLDVWGYCEGFQCGYLRFAGRLEIEPGRPARFLGCWLGFIRLGYGRCDLMQGSICRGRKNISYGRISAINGSVRPAVGSTCTWCRLRTFYYCFAIYKRVKRSLPRFLRSGGGVLR